MLSDIAVDLMLKGLLTRRLSVQWLMSII